MAAKKSMTGVIAIVVVVIVLLIVVGSLAGTYNKLVTLNEGVDGQWAQVETVYQRRLDLIPNLVNATKGFLKQEQGIYDKITQARAQYAGSSGNPAAQVEAANALESALSRLLVIVESNPEIKSNQTVSDLMVELAGTENRISVERRRFNETVQTYNIKVKRFPTNLLAGMFGFEDRSFFEASEGAEIAPTVDLEL
jgi:LemA protein